MISKRNLINLVLFALIVMLVILVVYEPGKKTSVTPPKLTNLKASNIKHIQITRASTNLNEQSIEFIKNSDGWGMEKPYQLSANNFRIESLLKLLEATSLSQNNLDRLNKNTFGLDKPSATITFNDKISIVFGHNKSLKNHRYVQVGSTLHMIADTFFYQLSAKSESYINHKVLPEKGKVIKLTLPNITLEKEEAKWNVTPVAGEFSADSVNQLITEWQLSQAYDIKIDEIKNNNKADIIILLDNNKTLKFKIGKNKESFVLRNIKTNVQYIMSADRRDKLLKLSGVNQDD